MSLYADDDLLHSDAIVQPSVSTLHAAPTDPVTALTSALSQPAESIQQAEALQAAGQRYEEHPEHLPKLVAQALPMVVEGGESLLRSWILDMVALAVGRSGLPIDLKSQVAQTSLEALNRLLHSNSTATIKAVIPIFSTIHPILFRLLATSRPPQPIYEAFMSSKSKILSFVLDPQAQPQNRGIKAAAWKFVQKVLLVGTRAPPVDPRLHRGGVAQDVSIAMIGSNSPLNVAQLEEEAKVLQTQLVTQMFSSTDPAVLHAIFNTLPILCKARQPLASLLVPSMAHWSPAALEAAQKPAMQIRAVERALRAVLGHLGRTPMMMNFTAQLNEAIIRQKQRMDMAFVQEQQERLLRKEQRAQIKVEPVVGVKHPLEAETSAEGAKRAKRESNEVDVSGVPLGMVIDAVVDGLSRISGEELQRVLEAAKKSLQDDSPDAVKLLAASLGVQPGVKVEDEEEVMNPLDMDVDDDDLLLSELPEEIEDEAITVTEFHLPPPGPLQTDEKEELVTSALERICLSGDELAGLPNVDVKDGVALAVQPKEAWMLVMARLATRMGKRKAVGEYVGKDFANRSKFAAVWLNEEWYSDLLNQTQNYPTHLDAVLSTLLTSVEGKDRSLSTFLTSLPEITPSVISTLASLCQEPERGVVGFIALRELIETRPPVRSIALPRLLELCTHPDRKIRYPAIKTVNRWVPESPMAADVVAYALGIMRRLVNEDKVSSPFLTEITPESIQQHVELAFALSRRRQEMLDDIFALYPQLDAPVAEQVEGLLTPLIQSLGPSPRLLDVLSRFPDGAEKLALRVVTILSGEGASSVLVNLVKGLMSERELDPRFIIPIIGELDKGEIEKQIPRIVALLNTPDTRDLVRTAFAAALQKLTPADLLCSLHDEEPGRKAAMEAIGICFSMTTVFRSDVLATALSRIADFPTLPIIFLRTTIQAVRTYKSLTPFIANNIFPKLIAKKVWENPPLWDGFVRVAKMIGKASFGSLLQLPREQLRDLLEKQPQMRGELRVFLEAKGMLRGQVNELFGEE